MKNYTPEQNFASLGLGLPPAPAPAGVYKPCLQDGKYLYVSGHGPIREDSTLITGRVGAELDAEQGKLAARQVGLAILATVRQHVGSLDKVRRVIKWTTATITNQAAPQTDQGHHRASAR